MANQVMERLHKHLYRFMIIDLILCFFIISTYTFSGAICSLVILILPVFAVLSFKNKYKNGDTMAIVVLLFLSIIFVISALYELSEDDASSTIQGILLILLSLSTFRRVKTIRDPTYKNWYNAMNENLEAVRGSISDNEVLATCPNCSTLLAVVPSKLSKDDKCPNCNDNLVN